MSGRALNLLRLLPAGEGFVAWRRLVEEYEPSSMSRHLSMLVGVLTPDWSDNTAFVDEFMRWERRVVEYEMATGSKLPDAVKCAAVVRYAPIRVRDYLRTVDSSVLESYGRLRLTLSTFFA